MNRHGPERCKDCGAPAAVRMQGVSFCARCGLERSSGGTNRISRRTALLGILSSGFLAKMVLGAVAVTALGGVAVSLPHETADAPIGPPASTQTLLQTDTAPVETDLVEPLPAGDALLERVHAYVESVQQWGDCVSDAAREHSGGPFDPKTTCGTTPAAAEHGLTTLPGKSATAPGQQDDPTGKSATAPGQQDPPGKSVDAPGLAGK
jgi:hypothetical protein